jgi:hypothetical protein
VKRVRASLLIAFMMMSGMCVLVAQFVVAPVKKHKSPSVAQLKEFCAEDLGGQLQHIACLMKSMSDVQCAVLEHMRALLENDKNHALNQKNNSELHVCHTRICMINESLQNIDKQLQEYAIFLEHKK